MYVKLFEAPAKEVKERIAEIARVSSKRPDKREDYEALMRYLKKNAHWSPFEHHFYTFEIETSRAISHQLIRHRSFTFQELSQRYMELESDTLFEPIELRYKAKTNRQSSEDVMESEYLEFKIDTFLEQAQALYLEMLASGVAPETARFILPACTRTVLYMTGNIRSWYHFLALRLDKHAQKEAQLIAEEIRAILHKETELALFEPAK